jgi:hypothetical protein
MNMPATRIRFQIAAPDGIFGFEGLLDGNAGRASQKSGEETFFQDSWISGTTHSRHGSRGHPVPCGAAYLERLCLAAPE